MACQHVQRAHGAQVSLPAGMHSGRRRPAAERALDKAAPRLQEAYM